MLMMMTGAGGFREKTVCIYIYVYIYLLFLREGEGEKEIKTGIGGTGRAPPRSVPGALAPPAIDRVLILNQLH